jgi:hypothetical protein
MEHNKNTAVFVKLNRKAAHFNVTNKQHDENLGYHGDEYKYGCLLECCSV